MKKLIFSTFLICTIVLSTFIFVVSASETILYQSDFPDGTVWDNVIEGGTTTFQPMLKGPTQSLAATSGSIVGKAFPQTSEMAPTADFILQTKLNLELAGGQKNAGIVFRAQNISGNGVMQLDGYFLWFQFAQTNQTYFDPIDVTISLVKITQGNQNIIATKQVRMNFDTFTDVKIIASGSRICAYVKDLTLPIIDINNADITSAGRIGVFSWYAPMAIANMKVTTIPAEGLLSSVTIGGDKRAYGSLTVTPVALNLNTSSATYKWYTVLDKDTSYTGIGVLTDGWVEIPGATSGIYTVPEIAINKYIACAMILGDQTVVSAPYGKIDFFDDDFSVAGKYTWITHDSVNAKVLNDAFRMEYGFSGKAYVEGSYEDFELETTMSTTTVADWRSLGIIFRASNVVADGNWNNFDGYSLNVVTRTNPADSYIEINKVTSVGTHQTIVSKGMTLYQNQEYKVKIVAYGGNIQVYFDDNKELEVVDATPIKSGGIGFSCQGTNGYFTYLKLSEMFKEPVFYSGYGTENQKIETSSFAGDITIISSFRNMGGVSIDKVTNVIAIYENGKFIKAVTQAKENVSSDGIWNEFNPMINVPNDGKTYTIKSFYWRDLDIIKPLKL